MAMVKIFSIMIINAYYRSGNPDLLKGDTGCIHCRIEFLKIDCLEMRHATIERLTERMAETKKKVSLRKQAKIEKAPEKDEKQTWWVQIRLFPIWLRIIIVLVLIVLAAILGAMVGYGVIGDGEARDALKWETWQHIIDIMSGKK